MNAFLRTTTFESEVGTLHVQLQDVEGNPARGYVLFRSQYGGHESVGTTDEGGQIRLEGVSASPGSLKAYLPGLSQPDLGSNRDTWPEDPELLNRATIYPRSVTITGGAEYQVTLQAKRVGYVRGTVRPAQGKSAADYFVGTEDWRAEYRYDDTSGDFLVGPLPEGNATIFVFQKEPGNRSLLRAAADVEIRSDHVARVEIATDEGAKLDRPLPGPARMLSGMGRLDMMGRVLRELHGTVLLSDGRTPAAGAALAYVGANNPSPIVLGYTDARGRISLQAGWYTDYWMDDDEQAGPKQTAIVVWLPGACGATIVPHKVAVPAKKLRIVLPPLRIARGKVTVGGRPIDARNAQLQVLAAHEGQDKLDSLLSLHVSAESDGSFELAGLTPGSYRVQATMDGIWLSATKQLVVAEGKPLEPLSLDVGEPGMGSVIRCMDAAGQRVAKVRATMTRPAGPMAELHWPGSFISDGAGVIHIPPLEVGEHRVQIAGVEQPLTLTVKPLADPNAKAEELKVRVDTPQP